MPILWRDDTAIVRRNARKAVGAEIYALKVRANPVLKYTHVCKDLITELHGGIR